MKRYFRIVYDIIHPCEMIVEADSIEEALIEDDDHFDWCGDDIEFAGGIPRVLDCYETKEEPHAARARIFPHKQRQNDLIKRDPFLQSEQERLRISRYLSGKRGPKRRWE